MKVLTSEEILFYLNSNGILFTVEAALGVLTMPCTLWCIFDKQYYYSALKIFLIIL
jgi:hypothetical protein